MAACCSNKGGSCKCAAPTSVSVAGYFRKAKARRNRKAAAAKARAARAAKPHFVAMDSAGNVCGHHHTTRRGAFRCANQLQRKARADHARLTRRQAKATRVRRWEVEAVRP